MTTREVKGALFARYLEYEYELEGMFREVGDKRSVEEMGFMWYEDRPEVWQEVVRRLVSRAIRW